MRLLWAKTVSIWILKGQNTSKSFTLQLKKQQENRGNKYTLIIHTLWWSWKQSFVVWSGVNKNLHRGSIAAHVNSAMTSVMPCTILQNISNSPFFKNSAQCIWAVEEDKKLCKGTFHSYLQRKQDLNSTVQEKRHLWLPMEIQFLCLTKIIHSTVLTQNS